MFIKSLKGTDFPVQYETCPNKEKTKSMKYVAKRHSRLNPEEAQRISWFKNKMEKGLQARAETGTGHRKSLFAFQNEYLKDITRQHQEPIDERKVSIKQKIKGRVKEQLADLVKRNDFIVNSQLNIRKKEDFTAQNDVSVTVQGSSIKSHHKINPYAEKRQKIRFEKSCLSIKKRQCKSVAKNREIENQPLQKRELKSARQRSQGMSKRKSLSSVIKLQRLENKAVRNIQSALHEVRRPPALVMESSSQIEPWGFHNDEF